MADVTVSIQYVSRSGVEVTYENALDAADHFRIDNDGRVFVVLKNAGSQAVTATLTTPNKVDGLAIADRTWSVPANEDRFAGPFPVGWYGSRLKFGTSASARLRIAALKVGD